MDTPEYIIEKDFKWNNTNELSYEDFKKDYIYSNLDADYRIKVFTIERNQADIDKLIERVKESRIYINQLLNN